MEQKQTKITDPHQALIKAQKYCAYQERSQQEVRDKLYSWGLYRNTVESVIADLIISGFLKEERFAIAYAGGKFRIKGWGRNKIAHALKLKKVPDKIIEIAIGEIDKREYEKTLKAIISSRSKEIREKNPL